MMGSKKNKRRCKGCVWIAQSEGRKVLCQFPRCVRADMRVWMRQKKKDDGKEKNH